MRWLAWILGAASLVVVVAWASPRLLGPDFGWPFPYGHFADSIAVGYVLVVVGGAAGGLLLERLVPCEQIAPPSSFLHVGWFALTLVMAAAHAALSAVSLPGTPLETTALVLGRVALWLAVISLTWLVTRSLASHTPRALRIVPCLGAILLPGLLLADIIGTIQWLTSLRIFVNRLDEAGGFDMARQLAAGGVEVPAAAATVILVGGALVFALLCWVVGKTSRVGAVPMAPRALLILAVLGWAVSFAEAGLGSLWKSDEHRRFAYARFHLHPGPFAPDPGVWETRVAFDRPSPRAGRPPLSAEPRIDGPVILVMVESMRSDALNAVDTPFLFRFRQEACQALGETWSASNATHLSWFGLFHGRLPVHWRNHWHDVNAERAEVQSPWMAALARAGYAFEIRSAIDLAYNGIGELNLGPAALAETWRDSGLGTDLAKRDVCEREQVLLPELQTSLARHGAGKRFYFLTLDSTHYNYQWPDAFEPPHDTYFRGSVFPAFPTSRERELVFGRYRNAMAWVDHQLDALVSFLKTEGLYARTTLIITGDHGEAFHEEGSWFHGSAMDQAQTGVPILIKWQEGIDAPAQPGASHTDLLPTLLDALGEPARLDAAGVSLLRGGGGSGAAPRAMTQVSTTSLAGHSGIAMVWRRLGWTARFRWARPWDGRIPDAVWLERIVSPAGDSVSGEYAAHLQEHFPDAWERYIGTSDE